MFTSQGSHFFSQISALLSQTSKLKHRQSLGQNVFSTASPQQVADSDAKNGPQWRPVLPVFFCWQICWNQQNLLQWIRSYFTLPTKTRKQRLQIGCVIKMVVVTFPLIRLLYFTGGWFHPFCDPITSPNRQPWVLWKLPWHLVALHHGPWHRLWKLDLNSGEQVKKPASSVSVGIYQGTYTSHFLWGL